MYLCITVPLIRILKVLRNDLTKVGWNAPKLPSGHVEPLTPAIDKLAHSGLQINLHAYRFCSPTRSSLLSGRLPIHVNQQNHPPEYPGGGIPLNMTTLADKLQGVGYSTHQIGKWHW